MEKYVTLALCKAHVFNLLTLFPPSSSLSVISHVCYNLRWKERKGSKLRTDKTFKANGCTQYTENWMIKMHCHLQYFRKIWPVYSEFPYPNFIYPDVFHFEQMVNQPSGCKAGWAFWQGFKILNKRMDKVHHRREAVWANTKLRAWLRLNVEKWKLHLSGARKWPR